MFHSIRWRLVFSFIGITLITLILAGAFTFTLLRQNIINQENAFLRSNAETVAQQASQLIFPQISMGDLQVLANTSSYLGNVRVKILDSNKNMLVDSGTREEVDQFAWILMPKVEYTEMYIETMLVPVSADQVNDENFLEKDLSFFDNLPPETRVKFVHRVYYPWGSQVKFESAPEQVDEGIPRSTVVMQVAIGPSDQPLGYVELSEGPDFGSDAISKATTSFLIAAALAIFIAGLVGFVFSKRLSSPLQKLTEVAGVMGSGDLSVRAPEKRKDEIGKLSRQFNRMAEQLQDSFAKLASERDSLRRFIADASHELRSPLTALKNFNELLQDSVQDDPQAHQEFLTESQMQINRLEWVTQNLLNLSRLDAGLINLNLVSTDVNDLIESAAATYKLQAAKKDVGLLIEPLSPPMRIMVDHTLIEIALSNLIDNALKFVKEGSGLITIGTDKMADNRLKIWVRDNGKGIDANDQPHIFERFYRGKTTQADGSGLGLAMVKSVVEAHSGTVTFDSKPGEGTLFIIELPILQEDSENVYKI